jgi:hypothetical protein
MIVIRACRQTHRESVGFRLLMPSHLPDLGLVLRAWSFEETAPTFHYYLHVVDQTMDDVKSLSTDYL